jgi:hypothetical protein
MQKYPSALLKTLLLTSAAVLSPVASAELDMGGSGGANTIQAKFDAFSVCNNKAKANGLGDEACDKEAKELRAMFGGGQTASATGKSESGQAKSYPADMKKTVKK